MSTAIENSFSVSGCLLGQCQHLNLYFAVLSWCEAHPFKHEITDLQHMGSETGTHLLTTPQTRLRLVSASGGLHTGDIIFLPQKGRGPCMCT